MSVTVRETLTCLSRKKGKLLKCNCGVFYINDLLHL